MGCNALPQGTVIGFSGNHGRMAIANLNRTLTLIQSQISLAGTRVGTMA
jgi:hypothetical protein